MKCDKCVFMCIESPDACCSKGHWSGINPYEPEPKTDPWKDCKDFENEDKPEQRQLQNKPKTA